MSDRWRKYIKYTKLPKCSFSAIVIFNIRRSAFRGFFHLIVTGFNIADAQLTRLGIERSARCTRLGEEGIHLSRFINKPLLFENVSRCGITSKVTLVATMTRLLASEIVCEKKKKKIINNIIYNRNLQKGFFRAFSSFYKLYLIVQNSNIFPKFWSIKICGLIFFNINLVS